MGAAARLIAEISDPEVTSRLTLGLASANAEAVASPAKALQERLERSFYSGYVQDAADCFYPEPYIEKLHPAMRLGIIATLTIGSWGGLIMGVRALLQLR